MPFIYNHLFNQYNLSFGYNLPYNYPRSYSSTFIYFHQSLTICCRLSLLFHLRSFGYLLNFSHICYMCFGPTMSTITIDMFSSLLERTARLLTQSSTRFYVHPIPKDGDNVITLSPKRKISKKYEILGGIHTTFAFRTHSN